MGLGASRDVIGKGGKRRLPSRGRGKTNATCDRRKKSGIEKLSWVFPRKGGGGEVRSCKRRIVGITHHIMQ